MRRGLLALWRGPPPARSAAALLGLLAAGSIALQIFSIDLLRRKLVFGEQLEQAVRERPEAVVVTDQWWVPQTLPHAFFDKSMFYIETPEKARSLLERLLQRGVGELLFITTNRDRPPVEGARVIDDQGLGFFSLRLEHHPLRSPGPARASAAAPRPSSRRRRRPIHAACRKSG